MSLSFTVTFRDLQKLVQSQSDPEQSQLSQRLRNKPFWIWEPNQHKQVDIRTKGDCCFNHIVGLPRKDGIEKSIFDYEKLLYDSLLIPEFYNDSKHNFKHKHLWVKKATGLGVTEFMLRLMAWLCLKDDSYRINLDYSKGQLTPAGSLDCPCRLCESSGLSGPVV